MTTIVDSFDRDVASGWGDTDSGHPWLLGGGLVSERTVAGGAGRVTLASSPGTIRVQRLARVWTDAEVLCQVVPGQVATGQGLIAAVALRCDPSDGNAFYRARLVLGADASVGLDVTRGVTQVGERVATGLTYAPGTRLWIRARVDGHRVRARVWEDDAAEPVVWTVDQTIASETIAAGYVGVMVSGFSGNTNTSPWVEVRQLRITYQLLVDNTLTGPTGDQVSSTALADSATTGTVTLRAAGARAVYDDARTVHGLPAVRIDSGHHRAETPQLRVSLPAPPWSARWYLWHPSVPAGNGDRQWIAAWAAAANPMGLSSYENASAQIGTRLQPTDLAATEHLASFSGPAPGPGQWLRVEVACDGAATTVRFYLEHALADPRQMVFGQVVTGTLDVTAYRFRRRTTLYWGDSGSEVVTLQQELISLGYNLGTAGADGDFGDLTYNAIVSFQTTRGLSPADGIPGPETRAAMDLALGRVPAPMYVSHLAVADGQWIGPAEPAPEDGEITPELTCGPLPI